MVNMVSKSNSFILVLALLVFSSSAFALPSISQMAETQPLEEQASLRPVPSFSLAVEQSPIADVIEPVPVAPPITSSPEPRSEPRGSGSSLTVSEMRLVMDGGRNYNPFTKSWGYREPFTGMVRERFMLSWEAQRQKVGAVDLLPYDLRYSK